MNYGRILLGGIVAGVIYFIGDGVVHGVILAKGWQGIATGLHLPKDESGGYLYFSLYDLAKGIGVVYLYAAIRPRFGAGPRTAALAGAIGWAFCIPIALCGLIPIHFFTRGFALLWAVAALVPMVIGAVAGAWPYREEVTATVAAPAAR
jgi:hypothetical protein